jgi:hypothetical protein
MRVRMRPTARQDEEVRAADEDTEAVVVEAHAQAVADQT